MNKLMRIVWKKCSICMLIKESASWVPFDVGNKKTVSCKYADAYLQDMLCRICIFILAYLQDTFLPLY